MANKPIMATATAVWLVDNSSLTFQQIADFCGLHELEVQGIADGEVASGILGFDPITNNQLEAEELKRGEADPAHALTLKEEPVEEGPKRRRGPRYTPLSKRQDRPAAIAWLVKNHPELSEAQIISLVGTTKTTIHAVQERTHWNINNIQPTDPVALGLCKQIELDGAVRVALERSGKDSGQQEPVKGKVLASVDESLSAGKTHSTLANLESFKLDPKA
ncbi:MAG: DUF1013 domain-containing protein [Rhodobacteraceae bacterium]|nr:DUF1013 domain-containing protein [Paracoccaceae bacterium]